MKSKNLLLTILCMVGLLITKAQNIFPSVGNAGVGTLTPVTNFQVLGTTRMGSATNFAQFGASGNLSFKGNAKYLVADNSYVFQMNSNNQYGLFFNSTLGKYEFKNGFGTPVFMIDVNLGNGEFSGGLKIGNTATAVSGNMRWSGTDFEGFDGTVWKSFTASAASGANTALSNLASTAVNVNLLPGLDNTRDLGSLSNSWRNAYVDGSYYLQGFRFINAKDQNVFVGRSTGAGISTGTNNTITGSQAGVKINTGSNNSFFGYGSGNLNTSGSSNTFIGTSTGKDNTTGTSNTLVGAYTGSGAGNGSLNTYMGYQTGSLDGSSNIGIGTNAFLLNEGSNNIAMGSAAGYFNKADNNIFIGNSSGYKNSLGTKNIFIGRNSGTENLLGGNNTFMGDETGKANTNGGNNTFLGYTAGRYNTTGSGNTNIGSLAGYNNSLGNNNTYIGSGADGSANWDNSIAIGFDALTTADNQVRIGNSSNTSIGGFVAWTNISDGRFKKNIKENIPGLSFINKLRPVSYNLDNTKIKSILRKNVSTVDDINAVTAMEQIIHTGFIAQEVEKAAKEVNFDFDGVDAPENENDYYGLRYSEFVVPLVKAVQQLSALNDELKNKYDELENKMQKLEQLLEANNKTGTSLNNSNFTTLKIQTIPLSTAALEQNIPNPFPNTTSIMYTLPLKYTKAQIVISDISGKTIKAINISGNGKGKLNLDASALTGGTYSYTLYVDGKLMGSKQMVITR